LPKGKSDHRRANGAAHSYYVKALEKDTALPERRWEILSSEYVIESPWYRLRRDACRLPDGSIIEHYFVRETPGFAVIFALTTDERVVFARQYKHGVGDVVFELPAGALEPGETPAECARRELEEETGYTAASFEHVAEFIADPTSSTGRAFVFLARDAAPDGVRAFDASEEIDVVLVPVARVIEEVRAGRVCTQSHVAAIYTVLDRVGLL
jgi:8-oxo-dGTP pyrophosphatase MutT (NUDIX family)